MYVTSCECLKPKNIIFSKYDKIIAKYALQCIMGKKKYKKSCKCHTFSLDIAIIAAHLGVQKGTAKEIDDSVTEEIKRRENLRKVNKKMFYVTVIQ